MAETSDDEVRRTLEERLARLRDDIGKLAAGNKGQAGAAAPQYGKRSGDHIAEAMEHRRDIIAGQNLQREVAAIEEALAKLEAGTYGHCDRCGGPIGAERLEALPWAILCIDCKRQSERPRR